ncbi:hypothetical protein [Tardiphaga sp. 862_B3_N1_1]|uniref:hypothetical protein n=1 Tax=Tardiphaga sp. 862_B3_N1_1 TaxID=3240763 RepID=UPI003F888D74
MARKQAPPQKLHATVSQSFTLMDELMASAVDPISPPLNAHRFKVARDSVEALRSPETATPKAWGTCCAVANSMETMLADGMVQDPGGLLQDAIAALQHAIASGDTLKGIISIPPEALPAVRHLIEDWCSVLEQAPARDVIRSMRKTEVRSRQIAAGKLRPGDKYVDFTRPAR